MLPCLGALTERGFANGLLIPDVRNLRFALAHLRYSVFHFTHVLGMLAGAPRRSEVSG